MSKGIERLPFTIVGFFMVLGIVVAIGLWYLALFLFAALVFILILIFARSHHKETRGLLQFRPGKTLPAEVWARARGSLMVQGTSAIELTFVELDKYAENWATFKRTMQVDRSGSLATEAYLVCFQSPTADKGVLLVHDRLILAEIRKAELPKYFPMIWDRGGILMVPCQVTFDENLNVARVNCILSYVEDDPSSLLRGPERLVWRSLWRGVRGKPME